MSKKTGSPDSRANTALQQVRFFVLRCKSMVSSGLSSNYFIIFAKRENLTGVFQPYLNRPSNWGGHQ